MIAVADYTVLVTDKNCNRVGDPIHCWSNIDVTLRFNEPSSGMVVCPGHEWIREQLGPGHRITIIRDGEYLITGRYERSLHETADDGENAGAGTLTINFADDLAQIMARGAYPNPALAPEDQVTDTWSYTDLTEHSLRYLVEWNAGPSALAARRVEKLELGAFVGLGSNVTVTAERNEPLGQVMRRIAAIDGLGFRTQQVGKAIEFQVYEPLDQSARVVFSYRTGSLKYRAYEVVAPSATAAIVGGQGEGADRYTIERSRPSEWGRYETPVNRPGNDPLADLQAAGDEALNEGAETARVAVTVMDTPTQRYGHEYWLGTRVGYESWPGSVIYDVVKTVHFQAWPTAGEVISPTIGAQAERTDPRWLQMMRALDKRIGYVERNMMPAAI